MCPGIACSLCLPSGACVSRGVPFVRGMCDPILGDAISGLFCEMFGCGIGDCRSIIDVCTNKLAEQNGREVVIVRLNVGNSLYSSNALWSWTVHLV